MAYFALRTDNLARFFKDINSYKVLTPREEEEKFYLYNCSEGKEKEMIGNEIIKSNLRYVVSVAKSFSNSEDRLADLIQEGNIGLCLAIDRFDVTKGYKFITFAKCLISLQIRMFLDGLNPVRQSNDKKIAPKVRKIRSMFLQVNEREATETEIAEILSVEYGIEVKDMRDIVTMSFTQLDKNVGEDDCTALDCGEIATRTAHTNSVEKAIEEEDNKRNCNLLLSFLTEKEKSVIVLSFGLNGREPLEDEDIAEKLGYTKERIRQIKKGAIAKMQKSNVAKLLR